MSLETDFEANLGEFPSLGRLTVGMSNRLRATPRYCCINMLGCGVRYGVGVCDTDVREALLWP